MAQVMAQLMQPAAQQQQQPAAAAAMQSRSPGELDSRACSFA